jgi:hypothetical protein
MPRAGLLCATFLVVAGGCADPIPSPELDPAFPTDGLSVGQALEIAREYQPSRGWETILSVQGGRFKDLIEPPYPDSLQWVWVVKMQGSYPRNSCQRPRMETPPPCPDVPYKMVAMDYHSGEVIYGQFGSGTEW